MVDVRLVFKTALEHFSTSILLCHNHPSGQLQPSSQDIQLTRKIKSAGEFLDIEIADHLIFTNHGYYSFAENGIL
jgi:DNA repair protein RadC